ncbi:hypothetical protein AV530_000021 [Patagioenas fasciata monilis]|uniref:Uncharacterized protein n=1 Tax=Patagioenas fasciata monilis TaxID=372326 RepID=A0A1V4K2Y7_PATFA|nr:hypothetical protein AV530_000021 [Patagioenas fasciata monilis]
MRNNLADTKGSKGVAEGAPGARAEIPLKSVEKTMVTQAVILQPMEDHAEADIHPVAHGDSMMQLVDALKEAAACGEPMLE